MTRALAALALLGVMAVPRVALARRETTLVREGPSIGAAVSAGMVGTRGRGSRERAGEGPRERRDHGGSHQRARRDIIGRPGTERSDAGPLDQHGRRSGRSGHWIFGVMAQQGVDRTEIRFPDRTIITRETVLNVTRRLVTGGITCGATVYAMESSWSTGGDERGPSQYIQLFVVWGRPTRS